MRPRRRLQAGTAVVLLAVALMGCRHTSKGPSSPSSSQPPKKLSTELLVGWITWDYDVYYKILTGNSTHERHVRQHVRWDLTGEPNSAGTAVKARVTFEGEQKFREDSPQVPAGAAGCELNPIWYHFDETWEVNNPLPDELGAQAEPNDLLRVRTAGSYPSSPNGYRPIGTKKVAVDSRECSHPARSSTDTRNLWQQALELLVPPEPSKEHREGSTSKTTAGTALAPPVDPLGFDPSPFGATPAVEISWSLDVLPDLCKKRTVTDQDLQLVRQILEQSGSYDDLVNRFGRAPLDVSDDPAPAPGVKGRAGIFASGPGARLFAREIDSRFDLVSTAAHESFHVGQIQERGFALTDAAPFLSLKEYTAVRWQAEAAAFDFQAKVLNELSRAGGATAACVAQRLALEDELNVQPPDKRRETVVKSSDYDAETIKKEWEQYSQRPKDPAVGNKVTTMRNVGAINDAVNDFQKWL